uniref:Uncharacterized protein n=1 Tax=Sciurus vulgaris TaxID=55149 RepID=A0A8D2D1J0_SCIVU
IQSREPSGSRAAERRRGCVPTPSGDRGPGSARPAAQGCAGGTAGQQRPLQVRSASAAAAPPQLLRWNRPPGSPGSTHYKSSLRARHSRTVGESADPCCFLIPCSHSLKEAPLSRQSGITTCGYKRMSKSRFRAERPELHL